MCHVNQGNVAQVTLSILQGQDMLGTGSKAVGVMPTWLCAATATSDALAVQTPGATFQTSASTVADKIVVFEITPEMCMDLVNGFHTIAVQTSASNAANITEAELFLWEFLPGGFGALDLGLIRFHRARAACPGDEILAAIPENYMTTTSKFHAGRLEFFDNATFEYVLPVAPVHFYEDFLGHSVRRGPGCRFGR